MGVTFANPSNVRKHLEELSYPAPRTVSKLGDQVSALLFVSSMPSISTNYHVAGVPLLEWLYDETEMAQVRYGIRFTYMLHLGLYIPLLEEYEARYGAFITHLLLILHQCISFQGLVSTCAHASVLLTVFPQLVSHQQGGIRFPSSLHSVHYVDRLCHQSHHNFQYGTGNEITRLYEPPSHIRRRKR